MPRSGSIAIQGRLAPDSVRIQIQKRFEVNADSI